MSPAWVLMRSPHHLSHCLVGEEGGGRATRASASGGTSDLATSSLLGVGVAGSSRSQELLVLADPSPVASSVSAGCDRRSRSREIGESTGDRFRLRSSCSSPSRGRDSREGRRCARSQSGGSRDRSRRRRSFRCNSSRSPSARVWSRQSRSRPSYRSHQVRSHSRSDSLRSQ